MPTCNRHQNETPPVSAWGYVGLSRIVPVLSGDRSVRPKPVA
ncbi:hypothetical protein [Laspinema olomoucense]|nr:hypothetical protein [Laspinema sp. D3d]